jgi:hypothetical protein
MYISYADTEEAANRFLAQYNPAGTIPIPIEEIVELHLGISIVPRLGLLREEGIDAFLSHDFTTLNIDQEHYMNHSNRCRFTLAHEIGHYVLHRDIIESIKTVEEWRRFVLGEGTGRAVYEIHADNFAGCLLMPRELVLAEYKAQKEMADKTFRAAKMNVPDDSIQIPFIANELARKFEVSQQAAEIRLRKIFQK